MAHQVRPALILRQISQKLTVTHRKFSFCPENEIYYTRHVNNRDAEDEDEDRFDDYCRLFKIFRSFEKLTELCITVPAGHITKCRAAATKSKDPSFRKSSAFKLACTASGLTSSVHRYSLTV